MAGLVPCALSGTSTTLRACSPCASSAARIARMPHSSPCAPALGLIATACMPVSVMQPVRRAWWISSSAPCTVSIGCQRMDVGEARQARHALVEARIVLHRAGAEREQAQVDRVVLAAEARIVAHRLRLGQAGEADRAGCAPARRARGGRLGRAVEIHAGACSRSPISNISGSSSISARLPVKVGAAALSLASAGVSGAPASSG